MFLNGNSNTVDIHKQQPTLHPLPMKDRNNRRRICQLNHSSDGRNFMIVNPIQAGWEVIYQPAHALLATQIASHWRADQRPTRWIETLVALAQHDDEAQEWKERNHLTDSGAPLDFTMSKSPSLKQPSHVTSELQHKGQWASLMISMHTTFLYSHLRAEGPEFAAFMNEQEENQRAWRTALKITKKEADAAYALFQWCDRMSLILCQRELPDGERALEVSVGPDGTRYDVICHESIISVEPWPFESPRFTLSVESYQLSQLSFKDDRELQTVLESTPVTQLTWEFAK
jgi:hypothetical protein